ncbi:MAG: hypothetical protein U5L95_01925 [Candidatus Saccharibacteria bacterium]|nr:hypothetical protein [Candidatus Saccharibacteria bacterium]
MQKRKLIRLSIVALAVTSFILLLFWVSTRGRLVISMESLSGSGTLTLVDDENMTETYPLNSSEETISLKSGNYTATVDSKDGRYFARVNVPGFFQSTNMGGELIKQRDHSFAIINPHPCVYGTGEPFAFFSSLCGGSLLSEVVFHTPASGTNPSYAKNIDVSQDGYVEGYIEEGGDSYLLVKLLETGRHRLFALADSGEVSADRIVGDLPTDLNLRVVDLKNGFLAYDTEYAIYYKVTDLNTLTASQAEAADQKDDKPLNAIRSNGEEFMFIYGGGHSIGSGERAEAVEAHADQLEEQGSTVVLKSESGQHELSFDEVRGADFCGNNYICIIHDEGLGVYEKDNGLQKTSLIPEGIGFTTIEDRLYISTSSAVIKFNPRETGGPVLYSAPGEGTLCGIRSFDSKIYPCFLSTKSRYTLLLDEETQDTMNISQRFLELEKNPIVKNVSIQNETIHIAPELGEPTYQEDIQTVGYSQDEISRVKSNLEQLIKDSSLRQEGYRVITGL